ncbi:hypothetical protein RDABS01_032131, partial [Bienertia sinuspersici]
MSFVTSRFNSRLIGHILFMKGVVLILSGLRNSMARIISILLFISCVYHLGRMSSPIFIRNPRNERKRLNSKKRDSSKKILLLPYFLKEKEHPDKIDEMEKIRVNGTDKTKDEFH